MNIYILYVYILVLNVCVFDKYYLYVCMNRVACIRLASLSLRLYVCLSISRSKALMSTGLVSTRSAPLRRKWSMSCCIALPVTPTIRPRYPRLRIASVAEGPSMLGML